MYFHLILFVGIPSSLILSVRSRGLKMFILSGQNLLSMTKVICYSVIVSKVDKEKKLREYKKSKEKELERGNN